MAQTLDKVYIEEYRQIVHHLTQQKENRLRRFVTEVSSGGYRYNFDRLGAVELSQKTGRRQDTPYTDEQFSRRVAIPQVLDNALSLESEDEAMMIINPRSEYAKAQAAAVNRAYDDIIIKAALGTALDGDGNVHPLPASQTIGDGSNPISFQMVADALALFLEKDVAPDEQKIMVIGPKQVSALLRDEKAISADYVSRQYLMNLSASGIVDNWMGFTWVMSTRLLAPAAGELNCFAFTPSAIGLEVVEDLFVRIGEVPSKSYMWQSYVKITAGAVRIDEDLVVKLHVADN